MPKNPRSADAAPPLTAATGTGTGTGTGAGSASSAPSNLPYYVDPALTAQVVQSLMGVLQNSTSPDAMEAQNILLRRLALEGDVVGSQPLGWISNTQPLAMVALPNDRPAGPAQSSLTLTFLVRSDFQAALHTALSGFHQTGATVPFQSATRISLPPAGPGAGATEDILFYLGRTLTLATTAALFDPTTDPLALIRTTGTSDAFQIAAAVIAPGSVPIVAGNYDAISCTATTSETVVLTNATFVTVAPVLAAAGFHPPNPLPMPTNILDRRWATFTNVTGLVPGATKLGDELALLYRPDEIVTSVFAPRVNELWDGTTFSGSSMTAVSVERITEN